MILERIDWSNSVNACTARARTERQVTLHDGRVVGSWSQEWNSECEAHRVCRMPTQAQRHAYILRVRVGNADGKNARGDAAANELERICQAIWRVELAKQRDDEAMERWCG